MSYHTYITNSRLRTLGSTGMARSLRTAPGMRERSPGVWELIVEAGRDPVTGKRRQASRIFRGNRTLLPWSG